MSGCDFCKGTSLENLTVNCPKCDRLYEHPDTERLDWLEENSDLGYDMLYALNDGQSSVSLREAIDAAREERDNG